MTAAEFQILQDRWAKSRAVCACGCGLAAPLAQRTNARKGHIKGMPLTFISGHNGRGKPRGDYTVSAQGFHTPCWLWNGSKDRKGYGRIQVNGIHTGAHRFFYRTLRGAIPEGMHIDHLCRIKSCVNPDHLETVTPAENNRRMRMLDVQS